jgi:hypothetical protein
MAGPREFDEGTALEAGNGLLLASREATSMRNLVRSMGISGLGIISPDTSKMPKGARRRYLLARFLSTVQIGHLHTIP